MNNVTRRSSTHIISKIVIYLLIFSLFVSCSPKPKDPAELLLGQWEPLDPEPGGLSVIEFVSSGTALYTYEDVNLIITYKYEVIDGDRLLITDESASRVMSYNIVGENLTLTTDGDVVHLRRKGPSSQTTSQNEPGLPEVLQGLLGNEKTKTRQKDGMAQILVPAGSFKMGSDNGGDYEKPVHEVYLDAYYIDKTEVTNAQYAKCVKAGKCDAPYESFSANGDSYYGNTSFSDFPVIYVSWYNARDYCEWTGGRLPTEAEWEKAARGTTSRAYPWGDGDPSCSLANSYNKSKGGDCVGDTSAVGSYPAGASPYGVMDMAGNVWEWVSDWYEEGYYSSQTSWNNPTGPSTGTTKVLRGGGLGDPWDYLRTAYRNGYYLTPGQDHYNNFSVIGFRCVSAEGN